MGKEQALSALWTGFLKPRIPGTIRRFHATNAKNLPSITKHGLKQMDPGTPWNPGAGEGIYTSVYPDYFHGMPGDAVLAIDIPKYEYKTYPKLPHNPETPEYRYGMGLLARQNNDIDLYERFIIDTINDKGRVDIFQGKPLKPEWFTDIFYVGPDNNIYRYKPESQTKMLDWSSIIPEDITKLFKTTDEYIGPSIFRK